MIRYGFACKTIGVPHADLTALTLARATPENMLAACRHNMAALANMLRYCRAVGIPLMRISSDIIPLASHPQNSFDWRAQLRPELDDLRAALAQTGVRVSMHPGQYTVLNSPREDVVEKAVDDLRFHADFLDALGAGQSARLVLHLGGGYGDKPSALRRLEEQVNALPPQARDRLSLENDERVYTIADAVRVCDRCGLPAIFDVFHHSLNPPDHGDTAYWLDRTAETWGAQHGRPKLHYSQQLPGGKPGMHLRFIAMREFLEFHRCLGQRELDVMLEVKDKNLSALKCRHLTQPQIARRDLTEQWARYKYLVLERDQAAYTAFRAMLKAATPDPTAFYALLEQALEKQPEPGQARNAAEHVWGYVDGFATPAETRRVRAAINALQENSAALPRVKRLLFSLAERHEVDYLRRSLYFFL